MKNIPPKDIAGQIHGHCFDHKDMDFKLWGQSVEQRTYNCWQGIHLVLKSWAEADQQGFLDYIKKNNPDL